MYKHILLPTDGSPLSARAVAAGVALAKALGARVTALFVAPPPTPLVFEHFLPVRYMDAGRARRDDRARGGARAGRRSRRRRRPPALPCATSS